MRCQGQPRVGKGYAALWVLGTMRQLYHACLFARDHRARADIFPQQTQFRLSEQLQQIGHRRFQADFDNFAGHRYDPVNYRQLAGNPAFPQIDKPPRQGNCNFVRGNIAAIIPPRFFQPKNIA